jgi:hypothetical protein
MMKNAGKAPSIQFYMKDWMTDLEDYPLEIEAAWLRVCNRIWHNHRSTGKITKSLDELGRIWNVPREQVRRILSFIKGQHIGGVTLRRNSVTLTCWRVERDAKLREQNRLRQQRHRASQGSNAPVTAKIPPSSSSSSSSTSIIPPIGEISHGVFSLQRFYDEGALQGVSEADAKMCFEHYGAQGWKFGNGLDIPDAKAAITKWRLKRPTCNRKENSDASSGRETGFADQQSNVGEVIDD